MSYKKTTVIDDKHKNDLEEYIAACFHEFLHNPKKARYDVAEQWFSDIIAASNTLESNTQTIIC